MLRRFCLSLLLLAAGIPAYASSLWNWNYSAAGISASGTFTTNSTPDAQGGYLITAITGMRNGIAITQLQPTGTAIPGNEPYAVDNIVYPGPSPQMTSGGFGFALSDGTYSNPFNAGFLPTPAYLEFFSDPTTGHTSEVTVTFSATHKPTPEPVTSQRFLFLLPLLAFALWLGILIFYVGRISK